MRVIEVLFSILDELKGLSSGASRIIASACNHESQQVHGCAEHEKRISGQRQGLSQIRNEALYTAQLPMRIFCVPVLSQIYILNTWFRRGIRSKSCCHVCSVISEFRFDPFSSLTEWRSENLPSHSMENAAGTVEQFWRKCLLVRFLWYGLPSIFDAKAVNNCADMYFGARGKGRRRR